MQINLYHERYKYNQETLFCKELYSTPILEYTYCHLLIHECLHFFIFFPSCLLLRFIIFFFSCNLLYQYDHLKTNLLKKYWGDKRTCQVMPNKIYFSVSILYDSIYQIHSSNNLVSLTFHPLSSFNSHQLAFHVGHIINLLRHTIPEALSIKHFMGDSPKAIPQRGLI